MSSTKRAFALRLNREALELLQNSPDKIQLDVNQDNGTSLVVDNKRFTMKRQLGHIPYELYRGPEEAGSTQHGAASRVDFVAKVLEVLTMKQVLSKEDKSRIRSRTEAAEREKNARRTELLTNTPKLSSSSSSSSPRNVLVGTAQPARRPVSSATSKSKSSSLRGLSPGRPDPAYVASVRERLIHLLAINSHPLGSLTTKLKIRESDLMPILKKAAEEVKGSWHLRREVYKDLRIWEWKRYDDKERNTVIRNAEDAYDALKLPRNAPERANLLAPRKKAAASSSSSSSHTASLLQPPPPQRVPTDQHPPTASPSTAAKSPGKRSAPSTSSSTASGSKHDEKRAKTESKSSKSKSSSSSSNSTARQSPQKASTKQHHPKPPPPPAAPTHHDHQPHTTSASLAPSHPTHPPSAPPPLAPSTHKGTLSSSGSSSSDTDSFYEEDQQVPQDHYQQPFVVSPITTQAQFVAMCKSHDEAQAEYIQLKRRIGRDHPQYLLALGLVEEPRDIKDEDLRRDKYYSKVKAAYRSQGGSDWRTVMQLTRQFNHQLSKVNALWTEVERAFEEHQFALPTTTVKR